MEGGKVRGAQIERPKAPRVRGMGRERPLLSRLGVSGSVVSRSPAENSFGAY